MAAIATFAAASADVPKSRIGAESATPPAIVKKLNVEINRVMQLPETQKRFASEGADPVSGTPEDFGRLITTEMVKWAKVAKSANIKAE